MDGRMLPPPLALAAAFFLALEPAQAQERRPTPPPRPTAIPLADEPLRLDRAGLKLFLPEGMVSQVERAGRFETVQISPPPPDQGWMVTVQSPQSANTEIAPAAVAEEALKQLLERIGIKHVTPDPDTGIKVKPEDPAAQVIQEVTELRIAGCQEPGARFYVRLARGPQEAPAVRGYSVFRAAPGRFVVFELFTTDDQFAGARAHYEMIVARAEFARPEEQAASRGVAVESGIALLADLGSKGLESLVTSKPEQLLRSYREAPGGADADALELGYTRIRARVGHRGELDSGRDPSKWDAADRQEGYIVIIEARTILRESDQLVDSLGTYFMTPERTDEAWTLQMAIRDASAKAARRGDATGTWFETGARSGDGMTISVSGKGQAEKVIRPVVPDQGYVTQAEMLLLPQILVRMKKPGEYGFYTYQSRQESVALRRDTLKESTDRPGLWVLTTRATEDAEPRISLYNDRGELIRSTLPDKTLVEPISKDRLLQLWKSKGLPMN